MTKIRQHSDARTDSGRCLYCFALPGAGDDGGFGERSCIERDDHNTKLMPEPAVRRFAVNDMDVIGDRLTQLQTEAEWARVVACCAGINGVSQKECNECAPDLRCKVCAIVRSEATALCLICHVPGGPSKPCPTRA